MNSVKKDLHRAQQKGLSELVTAVRLPGLKSTPPSSPAVLSPTDQHVKSYALWQELPQAKGLLGALTAPEIQLQEVCIAGDPKTCMFSNLDFGADDTFCVFCPGHV